MHEYETISEFNARLCDISNEAFALGEKYSEIELVRKILRVLPDRFLIKVIVIEEFKDIDTLRYDV